MSSALSARRHATVLAPPVAGLLIVAAFFLDPHIGGSGRDLARAYAEEPGRIQLSALSLRFAFALLIIPAVVLVWRVRARGAWVANAAGMFAVLGMTTLPGLLLVDFYDVAIYGELGGDAWQQVSDRLEALPGAVFLQVSAFLGFSLALPLALFAARRARLLPLWPAVALVFAEVASQALPSGLGLLVLAAALAALGPVLHRMHAPALPSAPRPVYVEIPV